MKLGTALVLAATLGLAGCSSASDDEQDSTPAPPPPIVHQLAWSATDCSLLTSPVYADLASVQGLLPDGYVVDESNVPGQAFVQANFVTCSDTSLAWISAPLSSYPAEVALPDALVSYLWDGVIGSMNTSRVENATAMTPFMVGTVSHASSTTGAAFTAETAAYSYAASYAVNHADELMLTGRERFVHQDARKATVLDLEVTKTTTRLPTAMEYNFQGTSVDMQVDDGAPALGKLAMLQATFALTQIPAN